MQFLNVSPRLLRRNPWNSNQLTPEAELKLQNSLQRLDVFKPIIVRETEGGLEILGGEHRADAAERLGMAEVPVVNLGPIDDSKAREISLADNARYGHDDAEALAAMLATMSDQADLASFLPMDMAQLEAMSSALSVDLETLGLADEDDAPIEPAAAHAPKTHVVMRFRIPIADQSMIEKIIKDTIKTQGLDDSDSMVNAGDALVVLLAGLGK